MQPVVVTGRHRPHEVLILALSVLLGAAFVVGAKAPGSIEELLPAWLRAVWYTLLLVSGTAGLTGVFLSNVYLGSVIERAAMWGQAAAWSMYALAIFALAGWRGLAAGALCTALAAASAWRLSQISRELGLLRRASKEDPWPRGCP